MFTNKSSEAFYNKGIIHYEKGEYNAAIDLFKQAIEKSSDNPQYYYNLGLAYVKTEEPDLAIDNFKTAISLNPNDADALQNLGIAYYKKSQFEEAIKSYNQSLEIKNTDPECYDNLGIAYFEIKQYIDAITCFQKALELNPKDPSIAHNLAFAYYTNEQYDKAEEKFLYLVSLNDKNEEAYYHLGNIYAKLQDKALAEENYKKTLSLHPGHKEAKLALQKLNEPETEKIEENITLQEDSEISEVASEIEPEPEPETTDTETNANECFTQAVNLLKEKNLELAIEELKKALSIKKDFPKALELLNKTTAILDEADKLFNQGKSCYENNKYLESIDYFKRALAIKQKSLEIKDLLDKALKKNLDLSLQKIEQQEKSITLINKDQYNVVVDALKMAIDENPKEPENHFNLGKVYIKQKDHNKAVDSLKETLYLNPAHKEAQSTLFDLISNINNADENFKYNYNLALAYMEKKRYNDALEQLKIILDFSPDNADAKNLFSKILTLMNSANISHSNLDTSSKSEEEITKLKKLIETNPADAEAHYKLGQLYAQTQNFASAKEYFSKTLELNPKHMEAQNALFDLIRVSNS